jgi:hypothetical protein
MDAESDQNAQKILTTVTISGLATLNPILKILGIKNENAFKMKNKPDSIK